MAQVLASEYFVNIITFVIIYIMIVSPLRIKLYFFEVTIFLLFCEQTVSGSCVSEIAHELGYNIEHIIYSALDVNPPWKNYRDIPMVYFLHIRTYTDAPPLPHTYTHGLFF